MYATLTKHGAITVSILSFIVIIYIFLLCQIYLTLLFPPSYCRVFSFIFTGRGCLACETSVMQCLSACLMLFS